MRHKPEHTCFDFCPACAYELGVQDTKRKPKKPAKYVWMVVGSDNPCDIRRYSFSHAEGIAQLSHCKRDFKDPYSGGTWTLFKLVQVSKKELPKKSKK